MKSQMLAVIQKDLRSVTTNKRMFASLLIVPLVLTVFLPSLFIFLLHFMPEESADFRKLLELLPVAVSDADLNEQILRLMLNHILPVFFLMIPIMASSIMAACAFVGEKEKHTLETLLYSPLSLQQIFRAKVLAAFLLSMFVSLVSFVLMLLVLEAEVYLTMSTFLLPGINWVLILLFIAPSFSMIAITLIVRSSAKAQSIEDAQQVAVFLLLPIVFLVVGQFTGILLVSAWILLLIGLFSALLAFLLLRQSMRNFQYERLLK